MEKYSSLTEVQGQFCLQIPVGPITIYFSIHKQRSTLARVKLFIQVALTPLDFHTSKYTIFLYFSSKPCIWCCLSLFGFWSNSIRPSNTVIILLEQFRTRSLLKEVTLYSVNLAIAKNTHLTKIFHNFSVQEKKRKFNIMTEEKLGSKDEFDEITPYIAIFPNEWIDNRTICSKIHRFKGSLTGLIC